MKMIPLFKVHMPESVIAPLQKTLMSGFIGEGEVVKQFEQQLGILVNNSNVLALNNGTAALQLALRLSDVGVGDEVITTPMTCSATNQPILALGAKPVWADINPDTGNIDVDSVASRITEKTKAIICVHWGGYPCDLDELNHIAKMYKLKLIEDACHALGSTYKDREIGCHSDFVCFSFQAIKLLTTVDGGLLACKDKDDCERGRLLRWYGIDRNAKCKDLRCEADIVEYGYKYHMNDVTATIGLEQLRYVPINLLHHRINARIYDDVFGNLSKVKPLKYESDRLSSYWLYTVRVNDRDKFIEHMRRCNIATSQVHARNDLHTIFQQSKAYLPGVYAFTSNQVSIPVGWWLSSDDIERIIDAVIDY